MIRQPYRRHPYAALAGALVTMLGGLVLVGWIADIAALKSVIPGMVTMKANTAACFLLIGMALVFASCDCLAAVRRFGSGLAIAVIAIGALTFYQYAAGVDLGIDQLLFREKIAVATTNPGRMASLTSLCFVLIGASLILLSGGAGRNRFATAPALAAGALAAFDFIGYLGASDLRAYAGYTRMALHTCAAFILLAGGVMAAGDRGGNTQPLDRVEIARGFSRTVAALVGILAGVVLIGWSTGIHSLASFIPGEMLPPKGAVAYMLISIGLILRLGPVAPRARRVADLLAIMGILIGSISLLQALFGITLGLDRFLVGALEGPGVADTGLTSIFPFGAVAITFLSIALFLQGRKRLDGGAAFLGLAIISLIAAALSLLGHLFVGSGLFGIPWVARMIFPSTVCALLLGLGMLASRPNHGPMQLLVSDFEGGRIARRVLPTVIVALIVVEYLIMRCEMSGFVDAQFGTAIRILGSLFIILPSVWFTARAADRSDAERDRSGRQFRNIFDLSADMICIAGADGLFKSVNPAWTTTLGYSTEEMVGKPFFDFIHPDDLEKTKAMVAAQSAGTRAIEFENRYRSKNGTSRHLLWMATPVMEDQCIYAIARDVTARKEAEQEREFLISRLAASNQELEAFTYSVSHDLRAPLRAIDGFSRILEEDCAGQIDAEGRRLLSVVRDNVSMMGNLIDDLLKFSRLGRKELNRQSVDMSGLANAVTAELTADAAPQPEVVIGDLPTVDGDASLLRQVWANLIGNAIKFSCKKSAPRIEIGGRRDEGGNVYWVKDNGAGFEMQFADKLFGVFQRLHRQDEFEGTGVGLALVQRIVTKHGGTIRAESEIGLGATFTFTLPTQGD